MSVIGNLDYYLSLGHYTMKICKHGLTAMMVSAMALSAPANAIPVDIAFSGVFTNATGSLASLQGAAFTSNIAYDTDPMLANPGSFAFVSSPNGENALSANFSNHTVSFDIAGSTLGFTSVESNVGEIDSKVNLTSAVTGGQIPDGDYNIFNFTEWGPNSTWTAGCSSTNSLVCPSGSESTPINAVNASLSFIGNASLFPTVAASSAFPATLDPANLVVTLLQFHQYQNGVLTGTATEAGELSGSFSDFSIALPLPATGWMFLSGVIGVLGCKRRKKL
jgi:hypothetical protein